MSATVKSVVVRLDGLLAALQKLFASKSLETIVSQCLAKSPEERPFNARAVQGEDDLARLVSEQARPGDMVVCLGAGTISTWANALPEKLKALKGAAA